MQRRSKVRSLMPLSRSELSRKIILMMQYVHLWAIREMLIFSRPKSIFSVRLALMLVYMLLVT